MAPKKNHLQFTVCGKNKINKNDSDFYNLFVMIISFNKLECEPMPNLMVALPNIGGALCSTPQSLADAHY